MTIVVGEYSQIVTKQDTHPALDEYDHLMIGQQDMKTFIDGLYRNDLVSWQVGFMRFLDSGVGGTRRGVFWFSIILPTCDYFPIRCCGVATETRICGARLIVAKLNFDTAIRM